MAENELKGLFGGGAAGAPAAPGAMADAAPRRRGGRRGGGGGGGGRRRQRMSAEEMSQAQDYINRYQTGHPAEGFSSDEAIGYLRQLQGQVPPEVLQRAAVQTVQNLPADQRQAFNQMLQRRQAGTGMVTIERTGQAHAAEGRSAAQGGDDVLGGLFGGLFGGGGAAQPMPQPAPGDSTGMNDVLGGLLGTLLGGGTAQPQSQAGGGPLGDVFGGLFGGPAEPQPQGRSQQPQDQGGNIGDILNSPLGKAVLGGIAAYAMQEVMQKTSRR
jgi:hypothetical protein